MRTRWLARVACLVVMLSGSSAVALAAGMGGGGFVGGDRTTNRDNREMKPSRYYVLRVMRSMEDVTFEVVANTDYSSKMKKYEEDYVQACKDWAKARSEAQKAKQEFTDKKPVKPRVERVGSFRKEEEAKANADKQQQQWEAMMAKKKGEEPPKDEKKKDDKKQAKKAG